MSKFTDWLGDIFLNQKPEQEDHTPTVEVYTELNQISDRVSSLRDNFFATSKKQTGVEKFDSYEVVITVRPRTYPKVGSLDAE